MEIEDGANCITGQRASRKTGADWDVSNGNEEMQNLCLNTVREPEHE